MPGQCSVITHNFSPTLQGDNNAGDTNTGNNTPAGSYSNVGNANQGSGNTGNMNVGQGNTGNMNVGQVQLDASIVDCLCTLPAPVLMLFFLLQGNTGNGNQGQGNTGAFNKGQGNTGALNNGQGNTVSSCLCNAMLARCAA